jgi:hypothetical protein
MGVTEMSFKQVMFFSGCVVAWFVLLPLCIVGGGLALLSYAVFSEVGELVVGDTKGRVDISTAREIARRVCLGY